MTSDPALHADVLGRFAGGTWGWLQRVSTTAIEAGEVRADVASSTVLETHRRVRRSSPPSSDRSTRSAPDWVDDVVELIMRGISP